MMKDSKRWAIICWVLSGLVFLGTVLASMRGFTADMIMDYLFSMAMLIVGFAHWKNRDKAEA